MNAKEDFSHGKLRFAGPPHRLRLEGATEGLSGERGLRFHPDGELAKFLESAPAHAFKLKVRQRTDDMRLRLKLNRVTPPGTYHAHLTDGEKNIPIEIKVGPHPRLRSVPSEIVFDGGSEAETEASITLENKGNVAIEIPRTLTTGIFDDDGIETAFATTYRQETGDVQALLGTFIGKLKESHGGLLKLRVAEGAGKLEPGEGRQIVLRTQLPSKLKGGHNYHGVLTLESLNLSLRVAVRKPATVEEK